MRARKFDAILALAVSLAARGATMTFDQLAHWLNRNGFTTGWDTPYVGGRGVATVVRSVYAYAHNELGLGEAGAVPVADAFTNKHGTYAFKV